MICAVASGVSFESFTNTAMVYRCPLGRTTNPASLIPMICPQGLRSPCSRFVSDDCSGVFQRAEEAVFSGLAGDEGLSDKRTITVCGEAVEENFKQTSLPRGEWSSFRNSGLNLGASRLRSCGWKSRSHRGCGYSSRFLGD